MPDSLPCTVGSNACASTGSCSAGTCVVAKAPCDDQDPCSNDTCDPFTGCKHTPASGATCTDDGNGCTQDLCDAGKCKHPNLSDGAACADDGIACTADKCTVTDGCGKCTYAPVAGCCTSDIQCDDSNPVFVNPTNPGAVCTTDKCVNNKCQYSKTAEGFSRNPFSYVLQGTIQMVQAISLFIRGNHP